MEGDTLLADALDARNAVALIRELEEDRGRVATLLVLVGKTLRKHLLRGGTVPCRLGGLVENLLVIVEAKPLHHLQKSLDRLGSGTLKVSVLHTQKEGAALVAGKEPIEDGGADVANVNLPRRRGRKTDAYRHIELISA